MKKLLWPALAGTALFMAMGPRAKKLLAATKLPVLPDDLDQFVNESEDHFTDIIKGARKEIIWADAESRAQTEYAIVYIHGFSATRKEIEPVSDLVANELGANLFYTRLRGHGRAPVAMEDVTATEWIEDVVEAIAIGRRLGKKVVLVGTSTGASIMLWLAANVSMHQIEAFILVSPNFRPASGTADLLLMPWGKQIATLTMGRFRKGQPRSAGHKKYWTLNYPHAVLPEMMRVVKALTDLDLSKVKVPTGIFLSREDKVVNAQATLDRFDEIGAAQKELFEINSDDASQHIIAGDSLSPGTTDEVVGKMLGFIRSLRS